VVAVSRDAGPTADGLGPSGGEHDESGLRSARLRCITRPMPWIAEITCRELAERLARPAGERPVLLDVRFEREHALVALPGSVLIPLPELEQRVAELEPHRGREVVVYCHHGVRSRTGAAILLANGWKAVSLEGGIHEWACDVDPSLPRY
jgi:rhodanese-related sulfurtransferase